MDFAGNLVVNTETSTVDACIPPVPMGSQRMKLEGSFRLSYNGSVFAREGLGYLLTFRNLIDTSKESGLVFRPLEPPLETTLYITWNRYQAFTPIAERFLKQLKESFFNAG